MILKQFSLLLLLLFPAFVTADDGKGSPILPPDQTPRIKASAEAPSAFRGIVEARAQGDKKLARQYADQYVRYMQSLMLEVREITQLIGEAMVRQGVIDEEDWVGVGQFLSKEIAEARTEKSELTSMTPETALELVKADPRGKAEIYIFCSASSRYCREMGPDIERINRIFKKDMDVKFGLYVIGDIKDPRVKAFKDYAGVTAPALDGNQLAKQFRVGFVPAILVRAPSTNEVYLRTGVVPFSRVFQLVKKVQGKPAILRDQDMQLVRAKIGLQEQEMPNSKGGVISVDYRGEQSSQASIEKF